MFDETTITAKSYKEKYYELRLNEYLAKYIDYDDLTFIENELGFFNNCFQSSIVELRENYGDPYDHNSQTIYYYDVLDETNGFVHNDKIYKALALPNGEFLQKDHPTNGWNLEKSERFKITFNKIIQFLKEKENEILETELGFSELSKTNTGTLNWIGEQTSFIELIKALIENRNIKVNKGEQAKTIDTLSKFFNITIH